MVFFSILSSITKKLENGEIMAIKQSEQLNRKNNLMIATLFLGYVMIYIDKLGVGVALVPIAKEFSLSTTQTGWIMSSFFVGYTLMQIPMGLLNNKIGSRKILVFSIFFVAIFMLLFGLGKSLIYFMLIRFLTGAIAHSGYPASSGKEISLNLPLNKRTFAQGILLASSGIAGIVGPVMVSPMIETIGWRKAYFVMAGLASLVMLVLLVFLPKEKHTNDKVLLDIPSKNKVPLLSIWKDSRVWILTVCAFFINSLVYGFTNWLPTFFTSAKGMSLTDAAKINSIAGIFALIGALGGSYIVGRYFAGKEKIVIAIFCIVGGCSMLGVYTFDSIILITLLLGIANFSMLVAFVTLMSIPLKLFINERFSPSYATIGTGGVMGGIFAPLIIGELIRVSNGNFLSTFIFFILMGIGAAGAIIFLKMNRQGGAINE